jgi:hypothetical protein
MGIGRFRRGTAAAVIAAVCVMTVTLAGCGQPEFTYVKNSDQHVYFKVPFSWHEIDEGQVHRFMLQGTDPDSATGQAMQQMRPWTVAYDEADPPALDHFYFSGAKPFVYARVEYLTETGRDQVNLDNLRDMVFPVSDSGRAEIEKQLADAEQQGHPLFNPLQDYERVDDVVLAPGHGLRGVRVIYNFRYVQQDPPFSTDIYTFDQTAFLSEDSTRIYLLVITCSATCYRERHAELDAIATSFTVRSSP